MSGLTLIELMITLIVAAIVGFVAFPNFTRMLEDNRVVTQTNDMVTAMNYARSEAVRRGDSITVSAVGGGLEDGLCVHLSGGNCDDPLRIYPAPDRVSVISDPLPVTFDGRGARLEPDGQTLITLAPAGCRSGAVDRARSITVGRTGRVSIGMEACP